MSAPEDHTNFLRDEYLMFTVWMRQGIDAGWVDEPKKKTANGKAFYLKIIIEDPE